MNPESSRRTQLFDQINNLELEARKKFRKCIPVYLPLSLLPGRIALKFLSSKTASYKHEAMLLNDELRQMEFEEDFPTVGKYLSAIDTLTSNIPEELRNVAYYPMAGLDIFWTSTFKHVVMEDKNYNIENDKFDLWWNRQDYNTEKLTSLFAHLKTKGMIPHGHQVFFVKDDSEKGLNFLKFNRTNSTLIYKSGHTFLNYARKMNKKEQISFGAIILSGDDPSSPPRKVDGFLAEQGYEVAYESKGRNPKHGSPWAIEIIDPRIYLKK